MSMTGNFAPAPPGDVENKAAQAYAIGVERLRQRKAAYQALGQYARDDLQKFCRFKTTAFSYDNPQFSLVLEGRRQVWLRIQEHLDLSPEQLADLYQLTINASALEQDNV